MTRFMHRFAAFAVLAPIASNVVAENSSATASNSDIVDVDKNTAAVVLTSKNYSKLTKGKTVFIKFFAPWCPHCQELAPAWEELASDWADDPVGLVGQVDCTSERALCEEHGIEGLPTLLYGDPTSDMEQYGDGKSIKELRDFAAKVLVPVCSPTNLDACDDEGGLGVTKEDMKRLLAMSVEEVGKLIEESERKLVEAEEEFDRGFKEMQAQYDQLSLQKEIQVAKHKERIRMMKDVRTRQ